MGLVTFPSRYGHARRSGTVRLQVDALALAYAGGEEERIRRDLASLYRDSAHIMESIAGRACRERIFSLGLQSLSKTSAGRSLLLTVEKVASEGHDQIRAFPVRVETEQGAEERRAWKGNHYSAPTFDHAPLEPVSPELRMTLIELGYAFRVLQERDLKEANEVAQGVRLWGRDGAWLRIWSLMTEGPQPAPEAAPMP